MIQPLELTLDLKVEIPRGKIVSTEMVWQILLSSYDGDLRKMKELLETCPELIYAQFNYTPPIYFAVREGHVEMVKYLLRNGACDPGYRFYPFRESLQEVAGDRGLNEIVELLNNYQADKSQHKYKGDNGDIDFNRTAMQAEFEKAVDINDTKTVANILSKHPEYALDETYFWGEGILMMPAKKNHREMIELLYAQGAKVPDVLKWTQFYYFERYDAASFLMEKGMNPDVMSWQRVTILHDMAQKGFVDKAELLIRHGANINSIDLAYQSTPLGLAARWGHEEMVKYLLANGADPNRSGANWATPLAWAESKKHKKIADILMAAGAV